MHKGCPFIEDKCKYPHVCTWVDAGSVIQPLCMLKIPMWLRTFEAVKVKNPVCDFRTDVERFHPMWSDGLDYMFHVDSMPGGPPVPIFPVSPVTSCLEVWCTELVGDPNAAFILEGIEHGFMLIDSDIILPKANCKDYNSTQGDSRVLVEEQIKKEVDMGQYIVCEEPPHSVSALGAIPKSAGKIRIIHDLSRPDGGMNRSAVDSSVHYPTLDDATKHMTTNSYLAEIDLHQAFKYTGLHWHFLDSDLPTYMFDYRLPFSASLSCKIFQSLLTI
jgi:hypothetical protein